jgi:AcrR family transcriptional regulator
VRAALELFTTQGYHASTTPQIAQRAKVAEGTIYRHFESKEQLLNEIYRASVSVLTQQVKDAPGAASCHDRLLHVATEWRALAGRDPAIVKLTFLTRLGGLLDAKSRDSRQQLRDEVSKVIAAGKSVGEVRAGTVEVWTDVWLQLVMLALERVATGEWTIQHIGPQQVFDAAWDAIRAPERGPGSA